MNRLERKDLPGTAADVWYGYDLQGHMTAAAFTASWTGITFGYDGLGRLAWTQNSMSGFNRALYYAYDAAGQRIRLYYPDDDANPTTDDYLVYNRDALGRPTLLQHSDGATLAQPVWDDAGRLYALWRPGTVASYTYDGLSRPSGIGLDLAGTANDLTLGFTYNPASQIATNTRSNDDYAFTGHYAVNRPYSANGLNQYTAAGPAGFSYDPRGNLISDGANTYVYDLENRLVSVSGAHNATLTYDPLGRLFEVSSAGVARRFLHDPGGGDTPAIVSEYGGTNNLLRRYHHGDGVDRPLVVQEADGSRRNLVADERGSIVAHANLDGSLHETINRCK